MTHAIAEIFIWLGGLSVGSFLNVVIYRLPSGMSVASPRWSFCPRCGKTIAWYDNLPVLSWILLWARCRRCRAPISAQYPIVEAMTAALFVTTYHLLFVEQARAELADPVLPRDLPLLLSWLMIAAVLLACSAMDIVSYSLDVRLCEFAVLAGIILHACWPRESFVADAANAPIGAACVAAFVVSVILLGPNAWSADESAPPAPDPELSPDTSSASAAASRESAAAPRVAACLALVIFLALPAAFWALAASSPSAGPAVHFAPYLAPAVILAVFAVMVLTSGEERAADAEIHKAIEDESAGARRTAWAELRWLTPILVAGIAAYVLVDRLDVAKAAWHWLVRTEPATGWTPVAGMVFSIGGTIVAASAGWAMRLVFTWVFGREALGVGDIYILAAAGAATGWDIALLGLLFSIGLALAGWSLSLLMKRTTMIPFGPPLALGFLAALWLNEPAAEAARHYHDSLRNVWNQRPDVLAVALGVLLIGSAAAVVIARKVRQFLEHGGDATDQA